MVHGDVLSDESCRVGAVAICSFDKTSYVLGGEAAAKQATGNFGCSCYTADSCSSWPPPCSWVSQLCWALDEVKVYWDFMQCAKRLGKLVVHPALLCPIRGTLLCQGLPSCF